MKIESESIVVDCKGQFGHTLARVINGILIIKRGEEYYVKKLEDLLAVSVDKREPSVIKCN